MKNIIKDHLYIKHRYRILRYCEQFSVGSICKIFYPWPINLEWHHIAVFIAVTHVLHVVLH